MTTTHLPAPIPASIAKKLDFARCCFVEMPADTTPPQMVAIETHFRHSFKKTVGELLFVKNHTLYIELPDTKTRNDFLKLMQRNYEQDGFLVLREVRLPAK